LGGGGQDDAMETRSRVKKRKSINEDLLGFLPRFCELGARGAKIISPSNVFTAAWVRGKCQFGCGGYGSSLMCPPYTPQPEETRKMLNGYKRAILFESGSGNTKKIAAQMEREIFLSGSYKALGLGAGPCSLCRSCSFENGCRHPDEARPSMEACGIDVFATARKHGFTINVVRTYQDPQHYFGLVLVE
jgi:predicted metal-binding protein